MNSEIQVLLVDDSPTDRFLTTEALSESRFEFRTCERLGDALIALEASQFDVVLLDLGLPDSQGLDTVRTLLRKNPEAAVVVLTGKDDLQLALQSLKEGVQDYLVKGELQGGALHRAIRYAVERGRSEKLLHRGEQRYRMLVEATSAIVWDTPASGKFETEQPGWRGFTGQTFVQYRGSGWINAVHPQDMEHTLHTWASARASQGKYEVEHRLRRADGEYRQMMVRAVPVTGSDGKISEWIGIHIDITERARTEFALKLRDRAIESLVQGLCITDPNQPDNPIVYVNDSFLRITGYTREELIGRNCRFLQGPKTSPESLAQLREAIREGRPCLVELLNYRKDGTNFWNGLSISPIRDTGGQVSHFVGVITDVSPLKLLEQQFNQSQKMEAFGQLASGIAHDFNNMLTVISGYSEMILSTKGLDDKLRDSITAIHEAGERAGALTQQLLAFSRKSVLEPKVLDLNVVVRDTSKMLRRMIGEDMSIALLLAEELKRIKVDPGQIGQVLMNLTINSRDAMPQGGRITIKTSDVELNAGDVARHADCKPGHYVRLTMCDTGCGMSPELRDRIFEPFFTTKEPGRGTGLGLATVYGIVRQSGGFIDVDTAPGQGTTFSIHIPAIDAQLDAETPDFRTGEELVGDETILVVEDEDAVRSMTVNILKNRGYHVLEASNGREAIGIVEKHRSRIALLVTDVVMPGMSGRELAEVLCHKYPGLKVLYSSGYTNDAIIRHGILFEEVTFLQKPYTPLTLARKVRDVLDGE